MCSFADPLPSPPPEYLRLIRDRANLKAQCLLFQAQQSGQLGMLDDRGSEKYDDYGCGVKCVFFFFLGRH